jgi:hypothetical protein
MQKSSSVPALKEQKPVVEPKKKKPRRRSKGSQNSQNSLNSVENSP